MPPNCCLPWLHFCQLLLLLHSACVAAHQCSYNACNPGDPNALNVHFVPHTHDDVGWLKTVDEYYYGTNNHIHNIKVKNILDNVMQALWIQPARRFIYVEMAYFWMWWSERHYNATLVNMVTALVNEGRLQFVLAGWSMNDEATTHYKAIIDQHTRGHRFLHSLFGDCAMPAVAWQIDPFGHSREQANLFSKMGFDSLFFWRLDSQDRTRRMKNKELEFIWHGSDDSADSSPMFTVIMEDGYFTPGDNCLEFLYCGAANINVDSMMEYIVRKADRFRGNHLMIPIGGDFHFEEAVKNFENIDKFIQDINAKKERVNNRTINAFYSTPACYTKAIHQLNLTLPLKPNNDFFPLMEEMDLVWVGFYSSRPTLKRFVRMLNGYLQAVEQLAVMSGMAVENSVNDRIDVLRRHMGILQHHDAITGTARIHVVDNYKWLLWYGLTNVSEIMAKLVLDLNFHQKNQTNLSWSTCPLLNISYCPITEAGQDITLVVYNGHSVKQNYWMRMPINASAYKVAVWCHSNTQFPTLLHHIIAPISIMPSNGHSDIPEDVVRKSPLEEFVFPVQLPAMGYATFEIMFVPTKSHERQGNANYGFEVVDLMKSPEYVLHNQHISLVLNTQTGLLQGEFMNKKKKIDHFQQTFCIYESKMEERKSGAYTFNPFPKLPTCYPNATARVFKSSTLTEIHQVFNDFISQVVRLYEDSKFVEMEWTVGPLPSGKEVITLYSTAWQNNGTFYTDANCRQRILRRRNQRDFANFRTYSTVAGNYYPIDCFAMLPASLETDNDSMFSVVTDRAQGGGSIFEGQLEIMLHRTTASDDGLGMEQALEEIDMLGDGFVARGKHYLLLSSSVETDILVREKAQEVFHEPFAWFLQSKVPSGSSSVRVPFPLWHGLQSHLPPQIRIMTLDRWLNNTKLLRLEHIFSRENPIMGVTVHVSLDKLFRTLQVVEMRELTLTGQKPTTRLVWQSTAGKEKPKAIQDEVLPGDVKITMEPMEIKTFQITVLIL